MHTNHHRMQSLDARRENTLRFAPKLLETILLLVLVWTTFKLFQPFTDPMIPHSITKQEKTLPTPNIEELIAVNLFGKPEVPQKISPAVKPSAAITPSILHIKLYGTVVRQDRSAALIMAEKNAIQRVYFVGDMILPKVTLTAVATTYIIIDHQNRQEKIMLEKDHHNVLAAQNNPATGMPNQPFTATTPFQANTPQSRGQGTNTFLNMISLSSLTPHIENGQTLGVKVNNLVMGSILGEAGLKKGDIIQNVNGVEVHSSNDMKQAYKTAKKAGYINLELIRDGQVLNLSKIIP